ncbi:MAG: N-formylglutamate amidohydrolase [Oligoflexus sp.]
MEEHVSPFTIIKAQAKNEVPIIINVPHAGVWFPPEDQRLFKAEITQHPPDTDWFVDQLYDFAPSMGASLMKANISRYVIDLNRPSNGQSLYQDGRSTPGLLPQQTFQGQDIYQEVVDVHSLKTKRISLYYEPYYEKLEALIQQKKERFGCCLLIDAHSIKRRVPSVRAEAFADIILGNNLGQSCDAKIIDLAQEILSSHYQVKVNEPFQGGHITRSFARPKEGIHCLQIEMSQDLYLDESNDSLIAKHQELKQHLTELTQALATVIREI